jgi:tyrosyl-tRNA synthetase
MESVSQRIRTLTQGTVDVIPAADLEKKLASNKPLVIKLGVDPTAPDLHLGHAVVLRKLRQFQLLGHQVVFLIGDFTARIGDPTGRSKTRPPLSDEEIATNTATYLNQVGKILDLNTVSIRYNSEWSQVLTSKDWIALCAKFTLARIIEREDFQQRLTQHISIGFHELLYPILQGYDSVALRADVELGGTDQTFNLLVGRFLQEQMGQAPQIIMTVPLLEGISGSTKMSKSYGNTISLNEAADQAFGKLMSISDHLMWHYRSILLYESSEESLALQDAINKGSVHPMDVKKQTAQAIVAAFWGNSEAQAAQHQFEELFQKRHYAEAPSIPLPPELAGSAQLVNAVKILGNCTSSSEARRLIEAGAVYINDVKITDVKACLTLESGTIIKIGKHKLFKIA